MSANSPRSSQRSHQEPDRYTEVWSVLSVTIATNSLSLATIPGRLPVSGNIGPQSRRGGAGSGGDSCGCEYGMHVILSPVEGTTLDPLVGGSPLNITLWFKVAHSVPLWLSTQLMYNSTLHPPTHILMICPFLPSFSFSSPLG